MEQALFVVRLLALSATLAGGIWLIIVAFQENVGWGIACVFVPFLSVVFAITHWTKSKVPFAIHWGGLAVLVAEALIRKGRL